MRDKVREMFAILDIKEESDSGRVFHPTTFTSCRVMDGEKLSEILNELKEMIST